VYAALAGNLFLERGLMHIAFEAIVGICTVLAAFFKMIEAAVKAIIMIADRVRAKKRRK